MGSGWAGLHLKTRSQGSVHHLLELADSGAGLPIGSAGPRCQSISIQKIKYLVNIEVRSNPLTREDQVSGTGKVRMG